MMTTQLGNVWWEVFQQIYAEIISDHNNERIIKSASHFTYIVIAKNHNKRNFRDNGFSIINLS